MKEQKNDDRLVKVYLPIILALITVVGGIASGVVPKVIDNIFPPKPPIDSIPTPQPSPEPDPTPETQIEATFCGVLTTAISEVTSGFPSLIGDIRSQDASSIEYNSKYEFQGFETFIEYDKEDREHFFYVELYEGNNEQTATNTVAGNAQQVESCGAFINKEDRGTALEGSTTYSFNGGDVILYKTSRASDDGTVIYHIYLAVERH